MVTAVLCKWYPFFHLSLICCSGLVSLFPCQLHACKAFRALSPCSEICTPSRWKTGERMVSRLLLPQETWICFCVTLEKSHSARLYLVTQCPAEIQSYCWALWLWNVAFPSCLLHLSLCCSTVPSDWALSAFVCCSELYFCPCALPLQIQTGSNSTSEWPTMDVCMHDQEQ